MQLQLEPIRAKRLSLTPLIDIIFLLLLFFMLSSTFLRYGQIEFDAANAGGGAAQKPDILIAISADGVRVNGAAAAPVQAALASLSGLEQAGAANAVIQTSESATSQDLILFLEAVRTQSSLSFVVVP